MSPSPYTSLLLHLSGRTEARPDAALPLREAQLSYNCKHHPENAHFTQFSALTSKRFYCRNNDSCFSGWDWREEFSILLSHLILSACTNQEIESPGPGPSLYSDQLTFHLYSVHLMRLQKPGLQRLSTAGHSDMGRAARPEQMEIRRRPGKGRTPGLCLGDGFKAEPWEHCSQDKWKVRDRQGCLRSLMTLRRTNKSHQEIRAPGFLPLPASLPTNHSLADLEQIMQEPHSSGTKIQPILEAQRGDSVSPSIVWVTLTQPQSWGERTRLDSSAARQ